MYNSNTQFGHPTIFTRLATEIILSVDALNEEHTVKDIECIST